jgi:hypothetical protein
MNKNNFQSTPQIQCPFIMYFSKAGVAEAFIIYEACIPLATYRPFLPCGSAYLFFTLSENIF